jgi:hypothetical protein
VFRFIARAVRDVLAIFVGYALYYGITQAVFQRLHLDAVHPPSAGMLVYYALYEATLAAASGYVAVFVGNRDDLRHARLVAAAIALAALMALTMHLQEGVRAIWSNLVALAAAPASLLGGLFRRRHRLRGTRRA